MNKYTKFGLLAILATTLVGCGSSGGGSHNDKPANTHLTKVNTVNATQYENATSTQTTDTNLENQVLSTNTQLVSNTAVEGNTDLTGSVQGPSAIRVLVSGKNGTYKRTTPLDNGQGPNSIVFGARDGGQITLDANVTISSTSSKVVVATGKGSLATNNKILTANGHNMIGMEALNGASVVNNGTIIVDGDNSIGMVASNKDSIATNNTNSTIILKGGSDAPHQVGMMAINGGTIDNKGTIKIATVPGNDLHHRALVIDKDSHIVNHGNVVFFKK